MQSVRENIARFNDTIRLTVSQLVGEFLPKKQFSNGWLFGGLTGGLPREGRGNQCTAIFAAKQHCH